MNGWGESIVHPDFPTFLGEVKSINPNALYSITTNLNIIKKEVIEFFTESKDSVITISIDAATKKTYEKIRCRGSWDSLWENMAELRRIIKQNNTGYPKLIVEFVVQKDNIHEISDFIKLIYEKVNPSKIMFQDVVAHPELSANYENYKEEIHDAIEYARKKGILLTSSGYKKMLRVIGEKVEVNPKGKVFCIEPFETIFLTATGDVRACCASSIVFGNVLSQSLSEIWNKLEYNLFRETMLGDKLDGECKTCQFKTCLEQRNYFLLKS